MAHENDESTEAQRIAAQLFGGTEPTSTAEPEAAPRPATQEQAAAKTEDQIGKEHGQLIGHLLGAQAEAKVRASGLFADADSIGETVLGAKPPPMNRRELDALERERSGDDPYDN